MVKTDLQSLIIVLKMVLRLCAFIVASLLVLAINKKAFGKKHSAIAMARVYPPCFPYDLPISYSDIKLKQTDNNLLVNYTMIVTEDMTNKNMIMYVDFQRCKGAEALDTCMKFTTMRCPKYCNMIESKNQVWSTFISCVHPTMHCPLLKGTYHGNNCYFDLENYAWFPMDGAFWKINITIYDNKRLVFCTMIGGTTKEVSV